MTRKRKEFPILENITITDVAAEGKALARVDDMVVFVPFLPAFRSLRRLQVAVSPI